MHTHTYIYIYIYRERERAPVAVNCMIFWPDIPGTPKLTSKISHRLFFFLPLCLSLLWFSHVRQGGCLWALPWETYCFTIIPAAVGGREGIFFSQVRFEARD